MFSVYGRVVQRQLSFISFNREKREKILAYSAKRRQEVWDEIYFHILTFTNVEQLLWDIFV